MTTRARNPEAATGEWLWPAALLAFLTAGAAVVYLWSAHLLDEQARREFRREAEVIAGWVESEMAASVEALYGLQGLFLASETVTRVEFERYVRALGLLHRMSGLRTVAYVEPRAPAGSRFVGSLVVRYAQSRGASGLLPGDGMELEPDLLSALEQARDSGVPTATPPLGPRSRSADRTFTMAVPIYADASVPATRDERRSKLKGFVITVFRAGELLAGSGLLTASRPTMDVEILDEGALDDADGSGGGRPGRMLFDADSVPRAAENRPFRETLPIAVAGRRWIVFTSAEARYVPQLERHLLAVFGGGLLLVAVLASANLWSLATSRARAVRIAEGMTRDLQESRRRLEQASRELARSNQELDEFASMASHDMKEPLRTIGGFAALLRRRCSPSLPAEAAEWLQFMEDAVARLTGMLDALLEYARVGGGRAEADEVRLDDAIEDARSSLRRLLEESGASVQSDGLPPVRGDRRQLARLFENLIGNAVKFRGAAPPVIRVTSARDGADWHLCVRDNGVGIAAEDRERVFSPFARSGDHGRSGHGLGLAICRKIVERHEGSIWIGSETEGGAAIHFTLPAAPSG